MISEVVHIEHSVLVNPDLSFSINMRTEIVFHIPEVRFPKIFLHVADQFISTRGINHVFISLSLQPEAPPHIVLLYLNDIILQFRMALIHTIGASHQLGRSKEPLRSSIPPDAVSIPECTEYRPATSFEMLGKRQYLLRLSNQRCQPQS